MGEDKQHVILRAATEVFYEQGFTNASMQAIAERAGVAKGTLYLYYQSKSELIDQVFIYCHESDVSACQDGLDEIEDALGKLCRRLENAVRWSMENAAMSRVERTILAAPNFQFGRYSGQKKQAQYVDRILEEGVRRGELKDMPREMMGEMFFGMGRAVLDYMHENPEDLENRVLWQQCFDCICGCLGK